MLDTVGRKSFLNHSWKYGHTPSTQTLIQCIKYLLAHLVLRRSRGSCPSCSFADPEPRAVMCTHPEPPPISWTFLLPLLTRTFFDHYISSKCCIITIPCPPSVRSSSPASEASAGLPLCKLGPCLHESPNTNHAWLILEEWIRLLLVKEILHNSIPYLSSVKSKEFLASPGM